MKWNWQKKNWPDFSYNIKDLEPIEALFLRESGILLGIHQHISEENKKTWIVEALSHEALKTSEIEGEYLDRDSMRSSIARHFGLITDRRKVGAAEAGIVELMIDLYENFATPLTHEQLFDWHLMLTQGRRDLGRVGYYRSHEEPMQVVSGYQDKFKVHFEAPPSKIVFQEMERFIQWFNQSAQSLPCLTRAGIAHLFFVSIHPFEDGNGRIARALATRAILQSMGQPLLIALSPVLQKNKKAYYAELDANNKNLEISDWLIYFAKMALEAKDLTQKMTEFLIFKAKCYQQHQGALNPRQLKVLNRLFEAGIEGFEGGLSAEKYVSITATSKATATRDLQELVEKKILVRTGELKGTRYYLHNGNSI